jgi:hypothetical protein
MESWLSVSPGRMKMTQQELIDEFATHPPVRRNKGGLERIEKVTESKGNPSPTAGKDF